MKASASGKCSARGVSVCGSVIADAVGECGAVVPHVMSNCFPFLFCLFFLIAVCVLFPLRSVFHVFLAFRSHCDLAIAMVPLLGHPVLDAALLQDLRGAAAPPCNGGCAQQSVRYTTLGRNITRRQSRAPARRSRVTLRTIPSVIPPHQLCSLSGVVVIT